MTRKAEAYHGDKIIRPYFEGWYFKHTSIDNQSISIIPGIYKGIDPSEDHAFIQILFSKDGISRYAKYPVNDFHGSNDEFSIRIKDSHFSCNNIIIDIDDGDFKLSGSLEYFDIIKLDTSLYSPTIMGPFAYIKRMQCNHGVLSLHHNVNGIIYYNDSKLNLDGAVGYIEKDWGSSFPERWIWMQTNCSLKQNEKFSLMFSMAVIPTGVSSFEGFLCVLLLNGRQYRFASYNNSNVQVKRYDEKGVEIVLKKIGYRLNVEVYRAKAGIIKAPTLTGMDRDITESLTASLRIELYKNDKLLYKDSCGNVGLEIIDASQFVK